MIDFEKFITEQKLLLEMPWFVVGGKGIDLEFETAPPDEHEFLRHLKNWLDSKPIKSKRNVEVVLTKDRVSDFARQLLDSELFKNLIRKKYGVTTWKSSVEPLLDRYLTDKR